MILLSLPFDPHRAAPPVRLRPFLLAVAPALVLTAGGMAIASQSDALAVAGRGLASAGVHSGLVALGWVLATQGGPGWQGPVRRFTLAQVLAALATRATPWGAILYLLPLAVLVRDGRRRSAAGALGLQWPREGAAIPLGLAAGAFLGAHLLVAASMTFGYGIRAESAGGYLGALAYDLGANAASAEWLFRGAIFSLAWRRWPFWPAAAASTLLAVGRYMVDPALPGTVEMLAGTVFYIGLLGLSACALRAWSGSLVPGYLATLGFFAAYRLLAP